VANATFVKQLLDRSETYGLLMAKRLLQQLKSIHRGSESARPAVVFVAGVQRSGTNMLMDVLERSMVTDVYHERDPRAFDNYQMREKSVIGDLYKRSSAEHFVIKSLCELQDLRQLMQTFSPAKTLWCFRRYPDVVNSMLVSFKNQAAQVKRVANDPDSDEWWGKGMSSSTHKLVSECVHQDIDDASACALQWYFRNILFFEQQFENNENVLLVCYEDLVKIPEQTFPRIFEFLEIPYRPFVSKNVFSSSIGKSNPPYLMPAVVSLCDELHRRLMNAYRNQNNGRVY